MKKGPLVTLFLTIFIDLLGFGIIIPFLPFYASEYGAKGWTAGALVGVYSLMQFLFAPFWGRLSDSTGRRPVLLMSLTGSMAGYLIFAFARSLPMLFAARILAGIAAANIGTAQAYIADITTPENRARGMGLIGAAFGMGFILGPPTGGILASVGHRLGYHANFLPGLLAASLSCIALLIAFTSLPESRPRELRTERRGLPAYLDRRVWSIIGSHRALRLLLITMFLIVLTFAGMETTVTLVARKEFRLDQMGLAWLFLFMGVLVAGIQGGGIGKLTKLFGERRVVLVGATSLATGLALVPVISQVRFLYVAAFFVAIGQGLCFPSLTSLVTRWSPSDRHGSLLGITSSVSSLSRMIGPLLGGALYDLGGTRAAFWTGSLVVAIAYSIMFQLRGDHSPGPDAAQAA